MIIPHANEFLTVSNISDHTNYISSDMLDDTERNGDQIEQSIIYKDLYDRLSNESQSVIRTILHSPQEIIDLWCKVKNKGNGFDVTRRKTRKYIRTNFKSPMNIIKELESFVRNMTW